MFSLRFTYLRLMLRSWYMRKKLIIAATLLGTLFTFYALWITPMVHEIHPQDLRTRLDKGEQPVLLDVREPEEVAIVHLPGAVHIPMGEIPGRLHELDPDKEIVVYCHHGVRSLRVAQFLAQRDFPRVVNLAGGIDAWALEVEPGMTRY